MIQKRNTNDESTLCNEAHYSDTPHASIAQANQYPREIGTILIHDCLLDFYIL